MPEISNVPRAHRVLVKVTFYLHALFRLSLREEFVGLGVYPIYEFGRPRYIALLRRPFQIDLTSQIAFLQKLFMLLKHHE